MQTIKNIFLYILSNIQILIIWLATGRANRKTHPTVKSSSSCGYANLLIWSTSQRSERIGPCRLSFCHTAPPHYPSTQETWLPIRQKITLKIAAFTFKALQNQQPSYLSDPIIHYVSIRNLRPLDKFLLTVPHSRCANGCVSFPLQRHPSGVLSHSHFDLVQSCPCFSPL